VGCGMSKEKLVGKDMCKEKPVPCPNPDNRYNNTLGVGKDEATTE